MTRDELISKATSEGKTLLLYMFEPVLFPYGEWVTIEPHQLRRDYDYKLMLQTIPSDLIFIDKVRKAQPVANPYGDDYHASEQLIAA